MLEKLYTVEEVAEIASVTGRTIRNYLKSGRLVGRKIGGQWRFPESEVQRLLEGGEPPPQQDTARDTLQAPGVGAEPDPRLYSYDSNIPSAEYENSQAEPEGGLHPDFPDFPDYSKDRKLTATYAPPTSLPDPPPPKENEPEAEAENPPFLQVAKSFDTPLPQVTELPTGPAKQEPDTPSPANSTSPQNDESATDGAASTKPEETSQQSPGGPVMFPPVQGQPIPYPADPNQPNPYVYGAQQQPGGYGTVYFPMPPGYPPGYMQQPGVMYPMPGQPYGMPVQPGQPVYPYPPYGTPPAQDGGVVQQPPAAPAEPKKEEPPATPELFTQKPQKPQMPMYDPGIHSTDTYPHIPAPGREEEEAAYPKAVIKYPGVQASEEPREPEPPPAATPPESTTQPDVDAEAEPAEKEEKRAISDLSDVGKKVMQYVSEVHDLSEGPQVCAVVDLYQSLATAKITSERVNELAEKESEMGIPCHCYVEFDARYYIARYTLFGSTSFLSACLNLIG